MKDLTQTVKTQPWRLIWPSTKKYPEDEAGAYSDTITVRKKTKRQRESRSSAPTPTPRSRRER